MSGEKEVLRIVGEVEIGKLCLVPGDVLVCRVDRAITDGLAARIKALVMPFLPDGAHALVIDPALDSSILTRAEIEAKAV